MASASSGPLLRRGRESTWSVKQAIGRVASGVLIIPEPRVVSGNGSVARMGEVCRELGCKKPLIVTDKILMNLGMVQPCIESLAQAGLSHALYDSVEPNPHTGLVEEAYAVYVEQGCDSIIAFGGGSPMDCAKIVGGMACNKKPVLQYAGLFNVTNMGLKKLPPFIAVPTTAGTGSETTIAAVITDAAARKKLAIADPGLVPRVAVLDPSLLARLPGDVTAATGMDALTHAIESYIGSWSSSTTERNSLAAVEKIFRYLERSFEVGDDMEAREAMLLASFQAGVAFTRASVGYVHAIAHQFGGLFHTPHGVANAMVLPYVLDFYLADESESSSEVQCTERLFEVAKAAGMASHYEEYDQSAKFRLARDLVARIRAMNEGMRLPQTVPLMKSSDVREVADRALKEAHGEMYGLRHPFKHLMDLGYPVPKHMTQGACEAIVAAFLPAEERVVWQRSGSGPPASRL